MRWCPHQMAARRNRGPEQAAHRSDRHREKAVQLSQGARIGHAPLATLQSTRMRRTRSGPWRRSFETLLAEVTQTKTIHVHVHDKHAHAHAVQHVTCTCTCHMHMHMYMCHMHMHMLFVVCCHVHVHVHVRSCSSCCHVVVMCTVARELRGE